MGGPDLQAKGHFFGGGGKRDISRPRSIRNIRCKPKLFGRWHQCCGFSVSTAAVSLYMMSLCCVERGRPKKKASPKKKAAGKKGKK